MKLERVEGVIFDLDETLIDAQQGLLAAHNRVTDTLKEFLLQKGAKVNREELLVDVQKFDDKMNRELRYDRDSWWPQLVKQISPRVKLTRNLIARLTNEYWDTYETAAVPYPDTIETLLYLTQEEYCLGLVSDTDGEVGHKAERIGRLDFRELFDVCIVSGDETAELKSSGVPFLLAADRMSVPPKACVVVGDKPFADVVGGKKAGMITVLIVRRRWNTDIEADYEFTSLTEIRTIL
ncbi:MAG: HAD family hydrolase [archaeon]